MLNQSPLIDQLTRQRVAELHAAACRQRLAGPSARLPRARHVMGRALIALGTRLAATETPATNHVTKLAAR